MGDIHGCLEQLKGLLERVRPSPEDRVVFLGDYIDRGPDPRGVVEFLLEFGRKFPRSVFLKGNHEAMLLDFLADREQFPFLLNGGEATLESYREAGKVRIPKEHLDFFESLPCSFETDAFIFVHAGLRPGLSLHAQREQDMLWIRDEFLASDYDWGKIVVFGHTPLREALLSRNKIGLDTAAVYGRHLSCCDVERRQLWRYP
ncbi:serine/threonine protein phosphatase [Desulfuromonas versatilis]|uniref:Serine/threonine protein phosphatase n=1 Tax=Desulfuromonas versatilis TaxID=2802975 RepID=A0ABN6E225_9BACT|nr:serine/threonine protein phosphatase [Desulfuromonas versatilis]